MKKLFIIAFETVFLLSGAPVLADDPDDDDEDEDWDDDDEGLVAEACNKTKTDIWVAYAAEDYDGDYFSRGWFLVRRGKCKVLDTDLPGDIYMVATDGEEVGEGDVWLPHEGGDRRPFCVDRYVEDDEFDYMEGNCKSQDQHAVKQKFGRVFDKDDDGIASFKVR